MSSNKKTSPRRKKLALAKETVKDLSPKGKSVRGGIQGQNTVLLTCRTCGPSGGICH